MVSGSIPPDLVEWMLADQKVCGQWRALGRRLGLGPHLPLVAGGWGATPGRRRSQGDRACLQGLLRLWQDRRPETFNVRTLKGALAAEGLHDMWMWVNMMTTGESPLRAAAEAAVYSRVSSPQATPSPSPCPSSPWSRHLYSPQPASPYSTFFRGSPSPSSTQDYSYPSVSSSPTSSRPPSRGSVASEQWTPRTRLAGSASCPTTPLASRRGHTPSQALASPGALQAPASPYRSSSTASPSPGARRRGVYDVLYRPDLIKLSSPVNWRRPTKGGGARGRSAEPESPAAGPWGRSTGPEGPANGSWGRSNEPEGPATGTWGRSSGPEGPATGSWGRSTEQEGPATGPWGRSPKTARARHQSAGGEEPAPGGLYSSSTSCTTTTLRSRHYSAGEAGGRPGRSGQSRPGGPGARELQAACDQLLQECRLQETGPDSSLLQEGRGSLLRECVRQEEGPLGSLLQEEGSPPGRVRTQLKIAVTPKSARPFSVSKVRSVRLDPEPILMPSPKRGSNNTYSEYFDNLLLLIDKASKDLGL